MSLLIFDRAPSRPHMGEDALSSFKEKHAAMRESLDFVKVKNYAVINLNNMFPVPEGQYEYVDIAREEDDKYRDLLRAEYRYIKKMEDKIRRSASILYRKKVEGKKCAAAERCIDFRRMEEMCRLYTPGISPEGQQSSGTQQKKRRL